jgi:hypothetical protein
MCSRITTCMQYVICCFIIGMYVPLSCCNMMCSRLASVTWSKCALWVNYCVTCKHLECTWKNMWTRNSWLRFTENIISIKLYIFHPIKYLKVSKNFYHHPLRTSLSNMCLQSLNWVLWMRQVRLRWRTVFLRNWDVINCRDEVCLCSKCTK